MARRNRTASSRAVAEQLRALSASLDGFDERAATALDIGRTDLRAMEVISRLGAPAAGDLARELDLTTGAVTGLVDRLVRAGYVERQSDEADRRRVVLSLTSRGRQRERAIFSPLESDTLRVLAGYSAVERGLIADFIARIVAVAETDRRRPLSPRDTGFIAYRHPRRTIAPRRPARSAASTA